MKNFGDRAAQVTLGGRPPYDFIVTKPDSALREESYVTELETSLQHFKSQVDALIASYKSELGLAREAQVREIVAWEL